MGFLSFNEKYYTDALRRFENRALGKSELYEIKQLLKLLDDLLDEGYTLLKITLEEKYCAISRLKAILKAHGVAPFPARKSVSLNTEYADPEMEIEAVCGKLAEHIKSDSAQTGNPFLADLKKYCEWIPHKTDTAYVFLLRDAFLPYFYFLRSGITDPEPWVINRDFLQQTAGRGIDDRLRLPIYEALEDGASNYLQLSEFCKPRIRKVLSGHPVLEASLREILGKIRKKKILVVESGYCGTIPLALSALDDRVDFRLYTSAPFLYEIYRDKIFCKKYEKIRSFETLYAQNALMKFSSFHDGRFYVKTAADEEIWKRAAAEAAALCGGDLENATHVRKMHD